METVKLRNGVEMPMEGFGVFQIPEETCEQVVRDAISAGCRLIDTASSYQNEKAVGRAIAGCGVPREELFITTKAYIQQMGYENTKQAFQESLDNLGLTYLDLYLIHMPFGDYYGSWRALEELYQAGKLRAIGVCNFLPDRLLDLCYNAKIQPQINQIERHPHYQRAEELALMGELNVQPEAWAPFAEGLKGMFTEPVLQEMDARPRSPSPECPAGRHRDSQVRPPGTDGGEPGHLGLCPGRGGYEKDHSPGQGRPLHAGYPEGQ